MSQWQTVLLPSFVSDMAASSGVVTPWPSYAVSAESSCFFPLSSGAGGDSSEMAADDSPATIREFSSPTIWSSSNYFSLWFAIFYCRVTICYIARLQSARGRVRGRRDCDEVRKRRKWRIGRQYSLQQHRFTPLLQVFYEIFDSRL